MSLPCRTALLNYGLRLCGSRSNRLTAPDWKIVLEKWVIKCSKCRRGGAAHPTQQFVCWAVWSWIFFGPVPVPSDWAMGQFARRVLAAIPLSTPHIGFWDVPRASMFAMIDCTFGGGAFDSIWGREWGEENMTPLPILSTDAAAAEHVNQ